MTGSPHSSLRVSALWVYPVKSCRGRSVERLVLGPMGPEGDRRFMVVDGEGRFLSQRTLPRMTLIRAGLLSGGGVRLEAEGEILEVGFPADGPLVPVEVWHDRVDALDCGDAAAGWLQRRLGRSCRLVAFPPGGRRVRRDGTERPTAFADAEPVLLTCEASLQAVNALLERPVPMERFRPNVVVAGAPAWAEDGWRRLRVGEAELVVVKPCARCAIVTVNPGTGERDTAPLAALGTIRRWEGQVWFGQNARVTVPGTVRVGDEVEVLETRG